MSIEDGHLEGDQEDVRHLTRAGMRRGEVPPGTRGRVSDEVLERRDDPGLLKAANIRRADGPDDIRVFGDALLDPAPSGIPDDIQDRRKALVDPQ